MKALASPSIDRAGALALGGLAIAGAALAAASAQPWPLLVALLIAPTLEEALFRAGLQDGLLHAGMPPWRANVLTALAFMAAHVLLLGVNAQTVSVLLPALLVGAAYNRWRRLRLCIALHMAMNALWVVLQRLI
jgi:membrane protease YdiL (CAAX protease family)